MTVKELKRHILAMSEATGAIDSELIDCLMNMLESGEVRAAQPGSKGEWKINEWVKSGILLAFRTGQTIPMGETAFGQFHDRSTIPPRTLAADSGVRIVPGGSAIRRGAHVASGVTLMPPSYINVGAYVGEETMVDSHALVGSCAQVGKRVHLSAACQIGGVLEPIGARPVIIEDDALIGGNCGVFEGVLVRKRAVLGAGLVLTASTPIYNLLAEEVIRPKIGEGLEIPEGAVVVPGTRAIKTRFGAKEGLSLSCGIIVKYRDSATDSRIALEDHLRESPGLDNAR